MAPVHNYTVSGTFTVTLTVTDDQGVTSTTTGSVSPLLSNVAPTAAFTSSCLGVTCTFDSAGSNDSDGSVVSYSWDLGDGASSTVPVVEHTYGANGTYNVSLLVTDDRGGTALVTKQVSVTSAVASVDFRAKAGTQVNANVAAVTIPSNVRSGDGLVLFASVAGNTTIGDPSGTGWIEGGRPDDHRLPCHAGVAEGCGHGRRRNGHVGDAARRVQDDARARGVLGYRSECARRQLVGAGGHGCDDPARDADRAGHTVGHGGRLVLG